jgi:cell division protein FtsZ
VKVTVIATGFDAVDRVAREEHAQYTRQTLAPLTVQSQVSRPSYASSTSRVAPAAAAQEAPQSVPATRRPHYANEVRPAVAAQPQSQQRIAPRSERTTSFPSLDHDWDVPAFQRKGQ